MSALPKGQVTLSLEEVERLLDVCVGVVIDDYNASRVRPSMREDWFLQLTWEDDECRTFEALYLREDNATVTACGSSIWLRREKEDGDTEGELDMLTLLEPMRITENL